MMQSIDYGKTNISFVINWKNRKTLGINVYPTGKVIVDAPKNADIQIVKNKVLKRAKWILKQIRLFDSLPPILPNYQFASGESFKYLGKQYRLLVNKGNNDTVKLKNGRLIVEAKNKNDVRQLLSDWFNEKAINIFDSVIDEIIQDVRIFNNIEKPLVKLRNMKRRWGSCLKKGTIQLNPLLVKAPKDCIRYVIIHELCHLKEHNHSKKFYKLLDEALPEWRNLKEKLNKNIDVRSI